MQIEFFSDKSGAFKPGIMFREFGTNDFKNFTDLTENKKNILYNLFADNNDCRKLISYQHSHGVRDRDEILKYIIAKKFARMDRKWDVEDCKLNFEN